MYFLSTSHSAVPAAVAWLENQTGLGRAVKSPQSTQNGTAHSETNKKQARRLNKVVLGGALFGWVPRATMGSSIAGLKRALA